VKLHTNLATIYGLKEDQLRFKYFDSGSDLVIAIQCGATVAAAIGTLLLQWWKGTRFSSYDTFDKKVNAVSKTLTIITDIRASVAKGTINDETGRNLTRRVLVEVERLVGLGATVPLDDAATVDQRELLLAKRDVKLLESGLPDEEEQNEDTTGGATPAGPESSPPGA